MNSQYAFFSPDLKIRILKGSHFQGHFNFFSFSFLKMSYRRNQQDKMLQLARLISFLLSNKKKKKKYFQIIKSLTIPCSTAYAVSACLLTELMNVSQHHRPPSQHESHKTKAVSIAIYLSHLYNTNSSHHTSTNTFNSVSHLFHSFIDANPKYIRP